MSIASVLALLVGAAAKVKSVQVARRSEDRILELEARVAELEDAVAVANASARRDQELIDIWRQRALAPIGLSRQQQQPAWPDFRPPQIAQQAAQMLQAQAACAHAQMQQAQYQNQGLGQAMGLLGAQNLIDAELFCNCVPARHDMFLRGE